MAPARNAYLLPQMLTLTA